MYFPNKQHYYFIFLLNDALKYLAINCANNSTHKHVFKTIIMSLCAFYVYCKNWIESDNKWYNNTKDKKNTLLLNGASNLILIHNNIECFVCLLLCNIFGMVVGASSLMHHCNRSFLPLARNIYFLQIGSTSQKFSIQKKMYNINNYGD